MSQWNPSAPDTLGLEWRPVLSGASVVDSPTAAVLQSQEVTVVETAANLKVRVGTLGVRGGLFAVEVYDNEDAACTPDEVAVGPDGEIVGVTYTTLTARPNEDVTRDLNGSGTSWVEDDATATSIYSEIDEATLNLADYIKLASQPASSVYTGRVDTATLTLTGKRVLAVRLTAVVAVSGAAALEIGLSIGGTLYKGRSNIVNTVNVPVSATWTYNPATKKPWTIADIQAFDSSDEFYLDGGAFAGAILAVYQVYLDVVITDENRLAVGTLDDTASGLTANVWNTVALTTPTGGAFTKDGTGRHLVLVRRLNDTGTLTIPWLSDGAAPPATGWGATLEPSFGTVIAMGAATTRTYPFVFHTGAADSVDSQPYVSLGAATVGGTTVADGEITSVGGDYSVLTFVAAAPETGNLEVTVHSRVDDSQVGGTLTFTPQDWADIPDVGSTYRVCSGVLDAVATLPAGQYAVRFSAAGDPWTVGYLATEGVGNAATFGGTTNQATVNGAESSATDLLVTLAAAPAPPTNFTAQLGTQTVTDSACDQDQVPYAGLSWTTAGVAGFDHYEVDRGQPGSTVWTRIVELSTEDVAANDGMSVTAGVASTPDTAELSILGDLDVYALVAPTAWTDPQTIVAHWGAAGNRSWRVMVEGGTLVFVYSLNGTAEVTKTATLGLVTVTTEGDAFWCRVTHDVDNGSGGSTVTFYTSADGIVWNALGAPVVTVGAGISRFDSSADITVGAVDAAPALSFVGQIMEAAILDTIGGTAVTHPVFSDHCGELSFAEASTEYLLDESGVILTDESSVPLLADGYSGGAGRTWTLSGDAVILCDAERFRDYEAPLGVAYCYRVRSVRTDGAFSTWASDCSVTKPVTRGVLMLVTNADPTLNAIYVYDPETSLEFAEAAEQVVLPIYGQDDSLAFLPSEARGTRARYVLSVRFDDHGTQSEGLAAFDGLRALARAHVPYVVVLDPYSGALYATLNAPDGTIREPGGEYRASLEAISVVGSNYVLRL